MPTPRSLPCPLLLGPWLGVLLAPAIAQAAEPRFVPAELAGPIRFLASDLLEGRGPGSRGDELARAYLASELEAAGLEPGAPDGSWQQRFPMVGITSEVPATWTFSGPGGELTLAQSIDFIASSGVQRPRAEIADAELVFVGYGIQAPEFGWDDFKGADLAGKVLVMLNNDPDWDEGLFEGRRRLYYGRWDYKYASAARQGAVGAIVIHTTPSASYPWQVVQSSWSGEQFALPAGDEPHLRVTAWTTESASARLAALGGQELARLTAAARSRDFRPIPLGVRTSLAFDVALRRVETANVAGLLRGADPERRDEVVVFTAHHDHLGMAGEVTEDAAHDPIYNGALDNATGCAQLLALARAFARQDPRPARSLLFLFVAAEEQGLLGSRHFAARPTFPPGKIAANVNLDSANVYGPTRDIVFIGHGKSSDLDGVVERAAARQGRVVRGDPAPEKGAFYRSDQLNFARLGVPAIYLDPGTEFVGPGAEAARARQQAYDSTCYHQPCDEVGEDWDYRGMIADTALAFEVGRELADAPAMPRWNPNDEFAALREAALTAAGQR